MENWQLLEPQPGDQIRVKVGDLYHHAIYIGNDEVIQFGHPFDMYTKPEDVKIIKSPISDLLSHGFIETRVYNKKELKQKRSNKEIIDIATSHLGEGGYNLLYNNCEHFVNNCIFGSKDSKQVDDIHKKVRELLGIKK